LKVSAVGIGTWAWGDKLFWGYGDRYGEADVEEAFQAAVGAGITFFDTAEVYGTGESERLLGRFCKTTSEHLQIATKFGPLPWRFTKASVLKAIEPVYSFLLSPSPPTSKSAVAGVPRRLRMVVRQGQEETHSFSEQSNFPSTFPLT
jgi:aryl-alcohol dehydrogenase-like predicted oxidoreductase